MLEKSKRILLLAPAFKPFIGGSEIAIENIVRRLPNIFFDILTPRYQRRLKRVETRDNFCLYRLGLGWIGDKYLFPVLGFFEAARLFGRHRYQIVHAYQASYGGGAAWLFKIFYPRVRFILTLQEGRALAGQPWPVKFFRRLILKKADLITGISHYLVDYAKMVNSRANFTVIPNGVEPAQFEFKNKDLNLGLLKAHLGIKESDRIIISVSRLVAKNGLHDLIAALAEVRKAIPEVKLLIAGRGHLERKLRLQAKRLGLENEILFLGQIGQQNLPKCLKIADVFVRPSYSEGLGSAFLEAMASGLAVIGTAVGGIPDFLTDGQTGLFCQVGNRRDLAEKIVRILTDHRLRADLAANGRALVNQRFTWQAAAERFADVYEV